MGNLRHACAHSQSRPGRRREQRSHRSLPADARTSPGVRLRDLLAVIIREVVKLPRPRWPSRYRRRSQPRAFTPISPAPGLWREGARCRLLGHFLHRQPPAKARTPWPSRGLHPRCSGERAVGRPQPALPRPGAVPADQRDLLRRLLSPNRLVSIVTPARRGATGAKLGCGNPTPEQDPP